MKISQLHSGVSDRPGKAPEKSSVKQLYGGQTNTDKTNWFTLIFEVFSPFINRKYSLKTLLIKYESYMFSSAGMSRLVFFTHCFDASSLASSDTKVRFMLFSEGERLHG